MNIYLSRRFQKLDLTIRKQGKNQENLKSFSKRCNRCPNAFCKLSLTKSQGETSKHTYIQHQLWGCLGRLRSCFCSSAPPTLPGSDSIVEFVEQVVLFGTQLSSSSRNGLFACKWYIMPLIYVCLFQ